MKGFLANVFDLFKQYIIVASPEIRNYISIAVMVTESIKRGEVYEQIYDNVPEDLKTKLEIAIGKVFTPDYLSNMESLSKTYKDMPKEQKSYTALNIASLIAFYLSDGELSMSEAINGVSMYYHTHVKK